MPTDLEIIKELQKEIGIELVVTKESVGRKNQTYQIDMNNNVIGLSLENVHLEELPRSIFKLNNLKELNLILNRITSLPSEISQLTRLTMLKLYNNNLTVLPKEIWRLKNLEYLDIGHNPISNVPHILLNIKKCKNINKLVLSSLTYEEIPKELWQLTHLVMLELRYNSLTSLPPDIAKLKNLTILDLFQNDLTKLPKEIGQLKNLTGLYLGRNSFTALPKEISKLKNLTVLNLSENSFTALPKEISKLKNLKELDLSYNLLTTLPKEITELGLEIYLEIDEDIDIGILVEDNPLEYPPIEIVKQGRDAIIEYFRSLEEGEKLPLNEVKVLFVGDGGSGKTSLMKQLFGEKFNPHELQTHGINIRDWKVEENDINVHFWDFGGQEIMHATHQFFLSKRSLYVLVLDGRKEERPEYWLKHIESFGGDSPILVVLNKMDEHPSYDLNRKFLLGKYPTIMGFYPISCKKGTGIIKFISALTDKLSKIEHIQTTWSANWFNVKSKLENMKCNFISLNEYDNMCRKEKINKKSAQNTLVDFLHDLGSILHFKDFELKDTYVLNPRWVTGGAYKIINSKKLAKTKGILDLNTLTDILKPKRDYPPDTHKYIINLMKKFELCYSIDNNTVLIPDLLGIQEPNFEFNYKTSLNFVIKYDFLPRSVMPRFIVKMHKDIKGELRWRTGVVLEDKEFQSIAVVKSDDEAKKIFIHVNGEQKRDYLSVILFNLREINRSFEKLKAIEKVPMPDDSEITVSYRHLIKLENKGIEDYIPEGSDKAYNVKDLLGTIHKEIKTEKEIIKILKKLMDESDTEETLMKKASDAVILQPTFFGMGVDIKKFVKKVFKKK